VFFVLLARFGTHLISLFCPQLTLSNLPALYTNPVGSVSLGYMSNGTWDSRKILRNSSFTRSFSS
jgi:hypothetical protein